MQSNANDLEMNLLELLQVLVRRKMFIVKACVLACVASIVYSLTIPNIYTATAKILPPQKESVGGLSSLVGQASALAGLATGLGSGDLYVGILKSRSVADAVLKRPEIWSFLKEQGVEKARNSLAASVAFQGGKDGIISISADNKDPHHAALIANAFVDELGKATIRLNLSKAGTERAFLERRLELVKKELASAEEEVKGFAQANKIIEVDSQGKTSIEGIAKLKADLAAREVQLSVLRSKQTEESPDVKATRAGIRQLQGQIQSLSSRNGNGEGVPAIGSVPAIALEYGRKMRELKTREAMFEQLTKQYEMAKLSEAKDSASLQVLDEAVPPINKSRPKRLQIVVLSTAFVLAISVLIVLIQEYLYRVPEDDRKVIEEIKKQAFSFR